MVPALPRKSRSSCPRLHSLSTSRTVLQGPMGIRYTATLNASYLRQRAPISCTLPRAARSPRSEGCRCFDQQTGNGAASILRAIRLQQERPRPMAPFLLNRPGHLALHHSKSRRRPFRSRRFGHHRRFLGCCQAVRSQFCPLRMVRLGPAARPAERHQATATDPDPRWLRESATQTGPPIRTKMLGHWRGPRGMPRCRRRTRAPAR
mmetsp:Transcript_17868/g.45346  ORF Transcript_17868/g.45346 Transcript_17868/m.45346 type:complete len:206 (+) Transcript_17868:156-773(+)